MKMLMIFSIAILSQYSLALNCTGTEPFWSAEVSEQSVKFENNSVEETKTFPISEISGANGYTADFIKIYWNADKPVAVVTSNECSDSMSDLVYPKEIILFDGKATYYGCCGKGVEPEVK